MAGVTLILMENGLNFPAADSDGRLTPVQAGRRIVTVGGIGTRDSVGHGFPVNPGAGSRIIAAHGTSMPASDGSGRAHLVAVERGKRPWWIGLWDRDGSVGLPPRGVAILELEEGPVDRDPIHQDLVILAPAPVLAPVIIPGGSCRFQLL